jgi:8-oxo-dGTP pyrophosphatase MutT (NUDIX family)
MTDAAAAPAAPRAAATILLLRDGPTGLEVFMVVRHHEIDFASGALVFPGGRMEATDVELAREAISFTDGIDEAARALRIAAIREAFEECGVLLARPKGDERIVPAERLSALDRSTPFAELMVAEGLAPATGALVPFARWITPAFLPKRFDTHFFLALAPPGHALTHDGREAVDSIWIAPRAALAEQGGRFKLVFPTERNLWKLARHADAASALAAARATAVVTVVPERTEVDGGPGLRIPLEADYGGEEFSLKGLF